MTATPSLEDLIERAAGVAGVMIIEGWQPIETVPDDRRVLLHNALWEETFGAIQIGCRQQGKWLFDGEMNVNDMDDIVGDDSGISAVDYLPQEWMPLPLEPAP